MSDAPRPKQHLIAAGKLYPGAWKWVDRFRADKGQGLPDWPDWCFVPIAATYGIVAADSGVDGSMLAHVHPERLGDPARLAALAAWRVTQGVYRFDPALYESVASTPIDKAMPSEVFYRLPEWCVYIETPDMEWAGSQLYGFWAHLEHDVNNQRSELRLLLDSEAELAPLPIHLGDWTLLEALNRVGKAANYHALYSGMTRRAALLDEHKDQLPIIAKALSPLLSLLLYLCSQAAEIGQGGERPSNPVPKRTKQGWRLFPAQKTRQWDVGVRIGAALRKAYQQSEIGQADIDPATGRARPRAHIRRAHWHGFWKGPKDPERASERKFLLKWMPPIHVNVDDSDLPVTIRPVKE